VKHEADSGKAVSVKQVQKCIFDTAGVSINTLKHILKEHKHNRKCVRNSAHFTDKCEKKIKIDMNSCEKCVI
jgi:hypothetical protein